MWCGGRAGGVLEFAGRADEQVKIRGFRVEPGEVEAVLAAHPQVAQAVVAAREDTPGDKRLAGYVVPAAGAGSDADGGGGRRGAGELAAAVRGFAAGRLPEYMVPAAVVVLDALPVTANGKVDRAALPAPDYAAGSAGPGPGHGRPRRSCAARSRRCWGWSGSGPRITSSSSGGHSLLAVSLVQRLRERGMPVSVRALFEAPTPAGLAAAAGPERGGGAAAADPGRGGADHAGDAAAGRADGGGDRPDHGAGGRRGGERGGCLPAGAVAGRHLLPPPDDRRTAAAAMCTCAPVVLGFDSRARLEGFLGALQQVIDRHDIYRTAVAWEGLGEPVQVVWRQRGCR